MRGHYNVSGAGSVFTQITGFPYVLDFSGDYAYYNPGETTANDVLARKSKKRGGCNAGGGIRSCCTFC